MHFSRYLKIYPDPGRPDGNLLYSTKRGSLIRLSTVLLSEIDRGSLAEEHRLTLSRLGMLVDDPAVELAEMHDLVRRANSRSMIFKGTIVLNLKCNLACTYCYEDEFRGNFEMSATTADALIDWITREHLEQGRDLELQFYGGEPLLSRPLIHRIAAPLRDAAVGLGRKFSISMTSNGTLLNRDVVNELLPYNFTKVNLTLDGPREIHDTQRPFVSGRGSFDTIIANIREIHDMVRIDLGGNCTPDNYRVFPDLLAYLLREGITPEMLGLVQFLPVTPKSGTGADITSGCASSNEPWLMEAVPYLHRGIIRHGYRTAKPTMAACMVEFDHDLVINYDGSFYKCPAFMGWPELSVGSLADGVKDYAASHNLLYWQNDECLTCPYLPLCFGGCRLNPLLKHGSIDRVDCRREFYDATLEKIVLAGRG